MDESKSVRPLSCDFVEGGLIFYLSDGTLRFIPNWTPPPDWLKPIEPKEDGQNINQYD